MATWNLNIKAAELSEMIADVQAEAEFCKDDERKRYFMLGAVSALKTIYEADELKPDRVRMFANAEYERITKNGTV